MLPDDLLRLRLANLHLASPRLDDPTLLVAQLCAVQAQDYGGARWALGQRLRNATDAAIERAFTNGAILRTHVLRPTWHFVAPADIRWLLALTAPRIKAAMAHTDRTLGIDDALFARSNAVIARALERGNYLTRIELDVALRQAGITSSNGQMLGHLMMRAELDSVVCSGPRRGNQFTYAPFDERAPAGPRLDREEAFAALTARYFMSHGPATVRDCAWWSGLTVADINRGLRLNDSRFNQETVGGLTYWYPPGTLPPMPEAAFLLANYDEYTVAYRERGLFYDPAHTGTSARRIDVPLGNVIVIAGRVAGLWSRTRRRESVAIKFCWFDGQCEPQRLALAAAAAERFGAFLGIRAELE